MARIQGTDYNPNGEIPNVPEICPNHSIEYQCMRHAGHSGPHQNDGLEWDDNGTIREMEF